METKNNKYKSRKEVIKELPKEMKVKDPMDVLAYDYILAKFKFRPTEEKDTDILSYKPMHNRFDVQFNNFRYMPKFNEHYGKFKYICKILNKLFHGTYFMDVKIIEVNEGEPTEYFYNIPMTTESLRRMFSDIKKFIEYKHYEYLKELRKEKSKSE